MQNLHQIQTEGLSPSMILEAESCIVPETCCTETATVCPEKNPCHKMTESESEVNLLDSRLDEQTKLIMILKNSAEETDAKCKNLEEENRNLAHIRNAGEKKLEKQANVVYGLTDNLKTLQMDYDNVSSTVKDLQSQKEKLLKEKSKIMEENDRLYKLAKSESQDQIGALEQAHRDLENQCAKQKQNISDERETIQLRKSQYKCSIANQKFVHKEEIKEMMDNLQLKKFATQETEKALKKEEEAYMNDLPIPEDVIKLEVKNKTLFKEEASIQRELLVEQLKTNDLRKLINGLEEKVHELNATFERKAAESQAKPMVQELYHKINGAQIQFQEGQEEIAKFKKEAQEKLQEEREINRTLRHIH